jgi:hypothetical protein
MRKFKRLAVVLILGMSLLFVSCSKENVEPEKVYNIRYDMVMVDTLNNSSNLNVSYNDDTDYLRGICIRGSISLTNLKWTSNIEPRIELSPVDIERLLYFKVIVYINDVIVNQRVYCNIKKDLFLVLLEGIEYESVYEIAPVIYTVR